MKRFNYRAREKSTGKQVKGSIQADTERLAGRLLVQQDLIPDSIIEEGATNPFTKFNNRITTKDHIMFTRQLATLIGAGLPLSASLRTVVEQTENKGMQAVGEEILAATESGKSLYEAFSAHPNVFNGVYLALIQAGEKSGTLDIALARLADQEEKDAAMLGKIRGALVYPAIILVVIIAVLLFMMFAVVPQVRDLYADMDKELPGLTQALVSMTDFVVNFWWLILIILVGGTAGLAFFVKRTPLGKKIADSFKIHVPLFGGLFRKLYVSRFARTAEMLLSTGVPMVDSVNIAIESVSNSVVEAEYSKAIELIKGGKSLSEALEDREYMLPLVPQMTGIGEESGKIDEMLGKAAKVYEDELYEQIENISTMIEPILMVVMAGLIGVVVGGTLLPIYSLVNSVGT
jgi:type II secretory pathway component PulF